MSSRAIRRLRQEKYCGNDYSYNDNDNDDNDDFDGLDLILPQTNKKKKNKKKKKRAVTDYLEDSDSENNDSENDNDHIKDDNNDSGDNNKGVHKDDDDDNLSLSSESSSVYEPTQKKQPTFSSLLMMDDSDSDEDEDEDASDSGGEGSEVSEDNRLETLQNKSELTIDGAKNIVDDGNKEDDDFDAILSEFHASDKKQQESSKVDADGDIKHTTVNIFLNDIDSRDYDLEHSLRSMLGGGGVGNLNANNVVRVAQGGVNNNMGGGGGRRNVTIQKRCLFAQGREDWGRRPSSYIGGGLGMEQVQFQTPSKSGISDDEGDGVTESLEKEKEEEEEEEKINNNDVTNEENCAPWPYSDPAMLPTSQKYVISSSSWYKFQRSNTYTTKLQEFQSYVSTTGDINMLVMFVADNPFVVEPILQLAMFFFHTRENEKGLDLVKRLLWILECACVSGFLPSPTTSRQSNNSGNSGKKTNFMFMDQGLEENKIFFSTLNLFIRNSTMVGCVNTSLAGSRLLLSLDPLRDPMGILLIMDYFCLATMKEADYEFVINLIESEMISIYHRRINHNGEYESSHSCELINMPNWRYSYALALYKLSFLVSDDDSDDGLKKASEALKVAITRYPLIPKLLLEKNKINTTGRSFQTDWPSVLSPLREFNEDLKIHEATIAGSLANDYQASNQKITKIFIDRSHKLWSGDDVVKWLYDCCVEVISADTQSNIQAIKCVPLALLRYSTYDITDFEDSFPHIPAAANVLDPRIVDLALHVRHNARRLLRMPQQQGGMLNEFNMEGQQAIQQIRTLLGTGRDGMEVIDPDLPIAEIFWRSLMPWARVDGVPPGNNN